MIIAAPCPRLQIIEYLVRFGEHWSPQARCSREHLSAVDIPLIGEQPMSRLVYVLNGLTSTTGKRQPIYGHETLPTSKGVLALAKELKLEIKFCRATANTRSSIDP